MSFPAPLLALLAETASHATGADHPALPHDAYWVAPVIGIIAMIFLGAAVYGPAHRAMAPEEPPAPSHDDHADGHGHGHGHGHAHDAHH